MPRRVYHPKGSAWQDVPDSRVDEWKAAGWRLTKPEHVDDSDALPVGEGYLPPAFPKERAVEVAPAKPAPEATGEKPAKKNTDN